MERCAEFYFDCTDEMGDPVQKRLVAELMGRTCNLYLLGPDGRIIDCLRRVGLDETSKRPALPGLIYQPPEPVTKLDPATLDSAGYGQILKNPGSDLLCSRLMDTLGGLSPLVCREAALWACGDTDARVEGLDREATADKLAQFFQTHLLQPRPWYFASGDTVKQFAFCPIMQYGKCQESGSFTELLDNFYIIRDKKDAMRQKSAAVRKNVQNLCQRTKRKLAIQEKELSATLDRERLRQLGDIVTANIHRIQKGQTTLEAEDFYDENMPLIQIPISPILSPQQNAAKFYKDYTRMKNAQRELTKQIELGQQELLYLQSVLEELNRAETEAELEEIRQELQAGGYMKADSGKRKMKTAKLPPMRFTSTDGYPIFVGRNNRQNDELTFRSARKDDLWLHASKVHGSHVIVACAGVTPPDDTVTQAAQLAAYYSEATGGQNIAVDVTPVKQVKKLPGAKPGMVIYHTYRTVIANPYRDIVVDALNAEKKPE
jgi:predicted ribosome quality control (RQC) complex YloA/Tae2 family protein